ncbi:MAG: FAD-dependent oxidoreductase, partial [Gammaproteobacteria bacterium]|nr:FAD-dependent oxidoreductase [Gammaproteobacteria bacterium]
MNTPDAKVVILGGGAIGLSTAYHLGKLGFENVTLLERNTLTSGTSWHAAGIVGPLRATQNLTALAKYALHLIEVIESETGQPTGYKQTGGLWLTICTDRIIELKRIAAMGEMNGLHASFLSPGELAERFPMINHHDLVGAMHLAEDGQINPVDLCMALAKGARQAGVKIHEHSGVSSIKVHNGLAKALITDQGEEIDCEVVVNCTGLWARSVGKLAGVNVPLQAVEHNYIVTEPISDFPEPWPVCRDMESALYIKGDAGKLVMGSFESNAKLWDHAKLDPSECFIELEEDWNHIEPMIKSGMHRVPVFRNIGISYFMTGPESFTPDTKPLMGRSPEVPNFYVAAGMNSLGIMSAPGVGKAMADWIAQEESPVDLWEVDIRRFQPKDNDQTFLQERTIEAVSNQFDMHWPLKQYRTGRNRTLSVWHEYFRKCGAVFGETGSWERPLWFADADEPAEIRYGYGDQCWWPVARRESMMLQNTGALFELSPFTKLLVEGPDALSTLQWLCTNDIRVPIGKVVYSLMLNERGGIECELTVIRTGENSYLLTSASSTRTRDKDWLTGHVGNRAVTVRDITQEYAVLGVMGPCSRAALSKLAHEVFEKQPFPFSTSRQINLAGARVRASRLSYVGELGWELMVHAHKACQVLDAVLEVAQNGEMGMAGLMTMESCRLEKGYLHWGQDIGPEDNPWQAGLGFSVKLDKPGGFLGQEALVELKHSIDRYLVLIETPDSRPLLLHEEPIYYNNRWVGRTTAGWP